MATRETAALVYVKRCVISLCRRHCNASMNGYRSLSCRQPPPPAVSARISASVLIRTFCPDGLALLGSDHCGAVRTSERWPTRSQAKIYIQPRIIYSQQQGGQDMQPRDGEGAGYAIRCIHSRIIAPTRAPIACAALSNISIHTMADLQQAHGR